MDTRDIMLVGEEATYELIDKMLRSVDLYTLGCTISREAAELSYGVMSKGEKNSEN